jgi:hypothetical protein
MGFPAEAATVLEFPMEMFLPGSDLTPIRENIDKIVYGLTKWKPKIKSKGVVTRPKIVVEGKDYQDAFNKMNYLLLKKMQSDGLPIVPATEDRLNWVLKGTDLAPDTVLGNIGPRGGIATVKETAVALAMAGGRPEYLPVLIATVQAMTDPLFMLSSMNATTCAICPVIIVNGPVAKQIRLNSGYGCLGPDPHHPAGGSIGRAIRLIQLCMGGAIPGSGSMSIYGGPGRYANIVFAEDEAGLPEGWKPLSVERGLPRGSNVVTALGAASTVNINNSEASTKKVALDFLNRTARIMSGDYGNMFTVPYVPDAQAGIVLMPSRVVQGIVDHLGWSKDQVKAYLWENSKIPWSVAVGDSYLNTEEKIKSVKAFGITEGQPWPLAVSPKEITIVVAGGEQSGHGYWMRRGNYPRAPVSREIKLPAKARWDELLKKAEQEIGPGR